MKPTRFWVVGAALLGLLLLQCSDPPDEPDTLHVDLGQTFELAYQQIAIVRNTGLTISLSTRLADTRCNGQPDCIDPGFVEIELYVTSQSAGSTHLVLGKYGLSWTGEASALAESWAGFNFELQTVWPDPYVLIVDKSATPPLPNWRTELRVIEEAPKPPLVTGATPVSFPPAQLMLDPFDLDSLSIEADTLFVHIAHGGGCKRHYFFMYMSPGTFGESDPVQANLYLRHDDNDDTCRKDCQDERCWSSTTLRFELTPIKALHQIIYGSSGPILLNVFHYFTETPGASSQILYSN